MQVLIRRLIRRFGYGAPGMDPPRRGFDEHAGYYDGCGTRYTHVQTCCGYGADPRNTYPFAHNPGGGWGNPVPGEKAVDYVCPWNISTEGSGPAYDWQATGVTLPGGCPPEGCTSTPDIHANHTGSCDIIRDRAIDFVKRVGNESAPYFLCKSRGKTSWIRKFLPVDFGCRLAVSEYSLPVHRRPKVD